MLCLKQSIITIFIFSNFLFLLLIFFYSFLSIIFSLLLIYIKDICPFKVVFNGISLSDDNYIFLNCTIGNDTIKKLHDIIYSDVLPTHYNKNIEYIPHITLGVSDDISFLNDFYYSFEDIIDEIVIEGIGIHQESIILDRIKLKDQK